jgi:hypothetical protein
VTLLDAAVKEPNFFILGAPKCGTTSLAAWLAAHPAAFMAPLKEPAYFARDLKVVRPDLPQYRALFSSAGEHHAAVGEASTCYLFSQVAVSAILEYTPEPRFIVCLRNPVDMVRSLHQQEVFGLNDDVRDFEQAWRLQETRVQGRYIPRTCREPWLLRYRERCLLGAQVERLLQQLPRQRIMFVLLDDLRANAPAQYLRVLRFLDLPDDGRAEFPVLNRSKEPRSRLVKEGVRVLSTAIRSMGITRKFGIRTTVERWNTREVARRESAQPFMQEIGDGFAADIQKLGRLIGRDLSHWST